MLNYRKLFAPENRGILLDLVVFFLNLLVISLLARMFADLGRNPHPDLFAQLLVISLCLALAFLQPLGSILKRRPAWQRNPDNRRPFGCLLHPVFYFLSKLLFLLGASVGIVILLYGDEPTTTTNYFGLAPWLFTLLFLGVPLVAISSTAVVYFYFVKPRRPPLFAFLESPESEWLGDICLYLNMIGHQMFWLYVISDLTKDHRGIVDRVFTFAFTSLLIYFPPRLIYLAEDGHRRLTWIMMLLANLPIIIRMLVS